MHSSVKQEKQRVANPETRIACVFAGCRCGAASAGIVVRPAAATAALLLLL